MDEDKKRVGIPFSLPSVDMGAVHSRDLFGLDELIIFAFYFRNQERYSRVVDLGANLGVHSGILASLGFLVSSYEPDPTHTAIARRVLARNALSESQVVWHQKAVVPQVEANDGFVQFVRVLGNTTSSHVKGAKEPYGDLETFSVPAVGIIDALKTADLVKMDVEGLEADLIESLLTSDVEIRFPDIICEVGNVKNSERIFTLAMSKGLKLYSQKNNWGTVMDPSGMPTTYKDGSLFLTVSEHTPWGNR